MMEETEVKIELKMAGSEEEILIVPFASEREFDSIKDIAEALGWTWPNGVKPNNMYPWIGIKEHNAFAFVGKNDSNLPKGLYKCDTTKKFCVSHLPHWTTYESFAASYGFTSEIFIFMESLDSLQKKLQIGT